MEISTPKHIRCISMNTCALAEKEKGRKDIILMKEIGQQSSVYFANLAFFSQFPSPGA